MEQSSRGRVRTEGERSVRNFKHSGSQMTTVPWDLSWGDFRLVILCLNPQATLGALDYFIPFDNFLSLA
jgi:hypothetical protein